MRLIPAHAGKTRLMIVGRIFLAAHPRSRGENSTTTTLRRTAAGSSPLTRGKPASRFWTVMSFRLIPAHAGKTRAASSMRLLRAAHPRSRGENLPDFGRFPFRTGSSPLTRGKLGVWGVACRSVRLIPAHAGKTRIADANSPWSAAHPRSRGENFEMPVCRMPQAGSSPLTRGKLRRSFRFVGRSRLIPAHAGKTAACSRS